MGVDWVEWVGVVNGVWARDFLLFVGIQGSLCWSGLERFKKIGGLMPCGLKGVCKVLPWKLGDW